MSLSAPRGVGASDPEPLSLLHQRLLSAEREAEALIQEMGTLGVSREQIMGSEEREGCTRRTVSPLKMRRLAGDEDVSWQQCNSLVSRVCRMESLLQTLKLTIFRMETERELDPSHSGHLRQQLAALQQESQEQRLASRREVMKLREQLQQAHQERDQALAQVTRLGDTVEAATAAKIDVALAAEELKVVKVEMSQKLMEMKEQVRQESARADQAVTSGELLHVEVQGCLQRLEEEKARGRQLEERCQQLQGQTALKDSLVSELRSEMKSVCLALQREQTENSKLLKEARATRSGCNVQHDLQAALTDNASLQQELKQLKGEHAHLLQSSRIAQETAVAQRELLESAIERLRGELAAAEREQRATREHLQASENQQTHQMLEDLPGNSAASCEKGNLKMADLGGVCSCAGDVFTQVLGNILASHTRGRADSQSLLQELGPAAVRKDRLQAQREIKRHQVEVEKLQQLLSCTQAVNSRAECVQKALQAARGDNQRLAHSLEQAASTNGALLRKLERAGDQYQTAVALRDEELRAARAEIARLSEELALARQQSGRDYESSMKTLQQEISQLKATVKCSWAGPGELSLANQELCRRVSELERQVSKQRGCIREQRRQLRQQLKNGDSQDSSNKAQRSEESNRRLQEKLRPDSQQVADVARWTSTIQRWEARREPAHCPEGHTH